MVWIDGWTGHVSSPARDAFLMLGVASLVVMVFLVVLVFQLERDEHGAEPAKRAKAARNLTLHQRSTPFAHYDDKTRRRIEPG